MNSRLRFFMVKMALCLPVFQFAQISPFIQVDQFGYRPQSAKVAVLSDPQIGYNRSQTYQPAGSIQLRNATTDVVVYESSPLLWNDGNMHDQSGDKGWWFDFSSIQTPGSYFVYDPLNQQRSAVFEIGENVYQEILKAAGRMYYYNRCGIEKKEDHAGEAWFDESSFDHPLQDKNCRYVNDRENESLEKDLSGGWFDAGDYNKYVTFAHSTIHNLLWAYQESSSSFDDNWNIPESGNGIPDILDEIKWELDWLLKMTNEDGSVHIKMGSIDFSDNSMAPPSANTDPRYYGPICSSAAIAVVSMFAHAAKVFADIPTMENYSELLKQKAVAAWEQVLPQLINGELDEGCDDGTIKAGDADWDTTLQQENAVTAAIHLFDLTGLDEYEQYIITNLEQTEQISTGFWGAYKTALNDALLLYTTIAGADVNTVQTIVESVFKEADNNWNGYFGFNDLDLYRSFMPDWSYHWGSNSPKAGYGVLNIQLVKYGIIPERDQSFWLKGEEQLHYFHGVNPLGLVLLSNMYDLGGDRCVNEIYHTWFADGTQWDHALNSPKGPPPGYVTGGPNMSFSVADLSPPSGQPMQKSYLDFNDNWPNNSWEISEPAIYYQANYIRLLAAFSNARTTTSTTGQSFQESTFEIGPNPTNGMLILKGSFPGFALRVISADGRMVIPFIKPPAERWRIDLTKEPSGLYLLQLMDDAGNTVHSEKIIRK